MTETGKANLTKNKARLLAWVNDIDRVLHEIAIKGTASASISAGGGSKTYTRLDVSKLKEIRSDYANRITQIQRRLAGVAATGMKVMTVRF